MTLFIIMSFFFGLKVVEGCFITLDWPEQLKHLIEISCSMSADGGHGGESEFEVQNQAE